MSADNSTPFDDWAEEPAQRPTQPLPVTPPRSRGGKLPVPTADLNDYGDLPPDDAVFVPSASAPLVSTPPAGSRRWPLVPLIGLSAVAGALLVVVISLAMNALIPKPPVNSDGLVGEEPRVAVTPQSSANDILDDDVIKIVPPQETGETSSSAKNAARRENLPDEEPPAMPAERSAAERSAAERSAGGSAPFSNTRRDYKITPPDGFTLQKRGRRTVWQGPHGAQLLVETTPASSASPRADWERLNENLARKYGERYRNLGIRETTIAGRPAAVWEFEITGKDGQTTRKMDVGVHARGTGYAVLGAAPAARFEELRPQFEAAVRSLELPSPQHAPQRSTPDTPPPAPQDMDGESSDDANLFEGY